MSDTPTIGAVGRGAIWSMVNSVSGQALSLIVFLVTARYVSKEAFGIMAVSLLTVEAFRQIVITSFGTALTAQKSPSDQDYNACFLLILISGIISAAGLFFLAGPVAHLLGHAEIEGTLKLICLILLTAGLSQTHEVWLSKHIQFKTLALRSVVSILVGGGLGIWMAVNGHGLNALIAQQIATAFTAVIFLWGATVWKPGLKTDKHNVVSLLRYSKYLFLSRATSFAGTQSDIFFSSYYLGAAATGTYNAAKRILLALSSTLSTALNAVALPAFAAFGHGNDGLGRGFLKAASLTSLLTAPLYFGLFVLSDDAIMILIGEKWLDAAPILSALVMSAYLTSVGQYNHNIFLVAGKPHWETILNIVYTVSNIALFIWLARYGAVWLAIAYSARSLVLYPLSLMPALHLLKMPLGSYLKEMAPSVIAATGMATAVYFLKIGVLGDLHVFVRLAILVPAGAAVYAGLIFVFNRKLFAEILHIVSHIRHK